MATEFDEIGGDVEMWPKKLVRLEGMSFCGQRSW